MGRIRFACSTCGKKLSTPEDRAGMIGTCPGCGGKVRVPPASVESLPAPADTAGAQAPTGQVSAAPPEGIGKSGVLVPASANLRRRFAGFVIDVGVLNALGLLVGVTLLLAGTDVSRHPYIYGIAICFAYYELLEGTWGVTLGKLLLRTKVVLEDGGKPDMSASLLRTLVRFVPFEALSAFSSSRRMWHDRWSGTVVRAVGRLSVWRILVVVVTVASFLLVGLLQSQ